MGCMNSKSEASSQFTGPLTKSEIQQRIVASQAAEHCSTGAVDFLYAYISQRGYYPDSPHKANQDAFYVMPNFGGPDRALFMVFDGHGKYGDLCAIYVRDHLPNNMLKHLQGKTSQDDIKEGLHRAFCLTNDQLYENPGIADDLSGTTCICVLVIGALMYIANVGDSRAIIARRQGEEYVAMPLSSDHTPYRKDERERVKAAGARVLTMGQIEGSVPVHENWGDLKLGDQLDEDGDPPRVWSQVGDFPGTAFTRSFGDSEAEKLGVFAEPEIDVVPITSEDAFICVASDGVYEFLTNKAVVDMVKKYSDPLAASRLVVQESYQAWLDLEGRTDDITMITALLTPKTVSASVPGALANPARAEQSRPVRRQAKDPAKRGLVMARSEEDDAPFNPDEHRFPKSDAERETILGTLQGSFIFQHTSEDQKRFLVDAMQKITVTAGQRVIKQGDPGDLFFIVEQGTFEVRMASDAAAIETNGGDLVHLYTATAHGVKPSFGELALMYSKPRAASIYASSNGVLWALDRTVFRRIMIRSTRQSLVKSLRRVPVLKALSATQTQRLCDIMSEVRFVEGDVIIKQGDIGESFFIMMEGTASVTQSQLGGLNYVTLLDLGPGDYFGERALLTKEPRAANVIASSKCVCLQIGKTAFEEVLGPLQPIIDEDRLRREALATQASVPAALDELHRQGVVHQDDLGAFQLVSRNSPTTANGGSGGGGPNQLFTLRLFIKTDVVESKQSGAVLGEAETLRKLAVLDSVGQCPNVQRLVCTFAEPDNLYFVFERNVVGDLSKFAREKGPGKIDSDVVRHVVACVAQGIAVLHEAGYLYRAVSSDMLFVDDRGLVVLSDFRFAKQDLHGFTMVGIPEYMSPEQVSQKGYGPACDWWALGILVHELMTGTTPFSDTREEATMSKIVNHVNGAIKLGIKKPPTGAQDLINALLNPSPEERLGSANGMTDVVQHRFLKGFDWAATLGTAQAPASLAEWATSRKSSLLGTEDVMESSTYSGDQEIFAGF